MNKINIKRILVSGVSIAIIAALGYMGTIELKLKSTPALADQPPQLKKEVINISTDNAISVNNTANPGNHLKYRLTYTNPSGNAEMTNVKILDVLPNDTSLVAVTDSGVYSSTDNSVSWVISRVAGGGSGTVNYEVKVSSVPDQTVIGNTAYLTADNYPQGVKSTEVKTTVSAPNLTLAADGDKTSVKRGEKIIYTITVKNSGSIEAQSVKVRDVLPTEVSFLESDVTPSSIEGNIIEFNLNNLATNVTKKITITGSVSKNAAAGSTMINNVIVNFTDKNGVVYPDVMKGISSSVAAGTTTGTTTKETQAPKTGGNIATSLIMSLLVGTFITLFFYYKHEPLSFASAKVSVMASKEKMERLQKNYFSGSSLKLQIESLKIRLKRII